MVLHPFRRRPYHKAAVRASQAGLPLLPTNLAANTAPMSRTSVFLPRRPGRMLFIIVVAFLLVVVYFVWINAMKEPREFQRLPPLYERYHKYEWNLPQHDLDLPYPEGRSARYIWMGNHVKNSGWGNYMQELVMNAQLAYASNRAFVFDNYTWDRDGPEFSTYNKKLIPSRIPLSAMISGPIIGGAFLLNNAKPRAVSKNFFKQVCPNPTIVDSQEINEHLRFDEAVGAGFILDKWVEKLNSIDDPCVEIFQGSDPIFEIWQFGNKRILDVWPFLSKSPILTQFDWAPLIQSAVQANILLLQSMLPAPASASKDRLEHFTGLLALHIRRGDYEQHCEQLAKWSARYNGFNDFESFPDQDRFNPPPGGGWGVNTPENMVTYSRHCYPSVDQIVAKVMAVRNTTEGLKNVYIMTNGPVSWLNELKAALIRAHPWETVTSSKDMSLNWEQKYVAHAVDMMIG